MKTNSVIIAALVLVLAIVVFLVVDLQSRNERDIVDLFQNQQFWIARQMVKELHDYLQDCQMDMIEFSSAQSLMRSDAERVSPRFKAHLKHIKYLRNISLHDATGKIVASTSQDRLGQYYEDGESIKWAQQPANRDRLLLTAMKVDRVGLKTPFSVEFLLIQPLYRDDHDAFAGSLAYSIDLNSLVLEQPILSGTRDVRVWIMDASGKLLIHSEHPEMILRSVDQASGKCMECHISLDYARVMLRERQGTIDYTIRNFPKKLAAFALLEFEDARWRIVITSPYDEVTTLAKKTTTETILLLSITIFAFVGGMVLFFRNHNLKLKAEEEARVLREKSVLEEKIQLLAAQLLTIQEDERRRLSRDLHDDVNQRLAMLAMDIELLEIKTPAAQQNIKLQLNSFGQRVAELSDCVRDLAYQLHPAILDDLGLVVALRSYIDDYAKREGIQVAFNERDLPESLDQDIATCLYRVVQEGLRNVAKHAEAKRATVTLERVGRDIRLEIRDWGVGFSPESQSRGTGLGLVSMKERVRLVHGDFSVTSKSGQGTQISVRIPLREASLASAMSDPPEAAAASRPNPNH